MGSLQTGFPLKFSLLHYLPLSHDGDSIQGQGLPAVCWMETSQKPVAAPCEKNGGIWEPEKQETHPSRGLSAI